MGLTHDEVAYRWVNTVLGRMSGRKLENHNMFADGDRLFSYGRHFELARILRDRKGNPTHWLINGDTFSNTTTRHQNATREAIARTGLPSVIIPHSVLNESGIEPETLKIIDVLPDRRITTTRHYREVQPGWQWRNDPITSRRDLTDEERDTWVAEQNAKAHREWEERNDALFADLEAGGIGLFSWQFPSSWDAQRRFPPKPKRWEDFEGWRRPSFVTVHHGTERNLYVSHTSQARQVQVSIDADGQVLYTDTWTRHVLGEALIEGTIPYTKRHRCKECGGTGTRPGVAEASEHWEAKLQEALEAAYAHGVGDYLEWRRVKNYRETATNVALASLKCPACATRFDGREGRSQGFYSTRHRRTAQFLSGFDHNEPRLSYFFCEMPDRKARTVEEAYDRLKPDSVRMAEQMGREVKRQGDIFAIPMPDLTKRDLTKMGARYERRGGLLGTNHVATEVAYLPDGTEWARGILRHAPQWRRPDHVMVRLDPKVWHLIRKNTVPVAVS